MSKLSLNQKLLITASFITILATLVVGFKEQLIYLFQGGRIDLVINLKSDKKVGLDSIRVILQTAFGKTIDTSYSDHQGRVIFTFLSKGRYKYIVVLRDTSIKYSTNISGTTNVYDTVSLPFKLPLKIISIPLKVDTPRAIHNVVHKPSVENKINNRNSRKILFIRHADSTQNKIKRILESLPDTFKVIVYKHAYNLSKSSFPESDIPKVTYDTVTHFGSGSDNMGYVVFWTDCRDCNWRIFCESTKGLRAGNGVFVSNEEPTWWDPRVFFWEVYTGKPYYYIIFDKQGNYYKDVLTVPYHKGLTVFIHKKRYDE